jgi:hypothetical protein
MKAMKIKNNTTGRRKFLSMLSAATAMGFLGVTGIRENILIDKPAPYLQKKAELPLINLGPHKISRLICGSNPLLGYSYLGSHTDKHMKEYFTTAQTVEFLLNCEKAGITTHQLSSRVEYLPALRERGSKLKIICLNSDREKIREEIKIVQPIAMAHHGGVTDRLFAAGKSNVVHDYVKTVKDGGLLAGVSAHNPDVIKKIADEGWEVDFFMTCFYWLTRPVEKESQATLPTGDYFFFRDDPAHMTNVIRQVKQPCLAYKILGGGRQCNSQEKVRAAFQYAFDNIKPEDGVIVGMFPWSFNEVGANADYTLELGKSEG